MFVQGGMSDTQEENAVGRLQMVPEPNPGSLPKAAAQMLK